ncbi:MAG: dicarboxylate/amino acid:cation symporter [Gemmatimonadota bacterium]|nr:dicarboxylate/amino acid:cation symporter [Gemmatimonadota bacterium]MDE3004601.1 dicarboxylate/amino acid:cation symporter [Gemmatimonadota bacterium]MDE3014878.1 dicarboxylate/amino acid:cation symporter [Gemmatimonadota bacterium]
MKVRYSALADRGSECKLRVMRSIGLGSQILIGMAVGSVLGIGLGEDVSMLRPVGDLFIRLLVLAAIPLVFFNLLAGVTALSDVKSFGRLAGKTMTYYVTTDVIALILGVGAMAVLRPGSGMQLTGEIDGSVGAVPSVADVLLGMIPTNVFAAFAEGNVVQIVVIAVLVGIATLLLPAESRIRLVRAYHDVASLFRRLVDVILLTAPFGIGALMAVTVGTYGAALLGPMARFLLGVYLAQLVVFVGYMGLMKFGADRSPLRFLRETGPLWATTAATTSSLASLSVSLETAERIRLPSSIYSFTLPLGAQLNKDGTSVMLGAVLLFTAQAAGVSFTPASLVSVVLVGLLLSEGSGGIPGGGFVIALIYVQAFNLPIEVAAIVGGIYRLVDMGNTTINVMGDLVGTSLVTRSESRRGIP